SRPDFRPPGRAARLPARVRAHAAQRLLDADNDHAGIHEGGIQCALRTGGCPPPHGHVEDSPGARRGAVLSHLDQGHHDLQPAARVRPPERRVVAAGGRLRRLDRHRAVADPQRRRAPAPLRHHGLSRGPRLRADRHAPIRGPTLTRRAMKTLVLVPTYNERENLPILVGEVMEVPGAEVLVIDDQSPDGTGHLADELSVRYPGRVRVMHRTGPRGLGRSYRDGFRYALDTDADFVVQMDADRSHDPKYLPAMIAAGAAG